MDKPLRITVIGSQGGLRSVYSATLRGLADRHPDIIRVTSVDLDDTVQGYRPNFAVLDDFGTPDQEALRQYICGDFTPDPRAQALYARLAKYYRDTPDSMSNSAAARYWREFKSWAGHHGYTQDEINRAKGLVSRDPDAYLEIPDARK